MLSFDTARYPEFFRELDSGVEKHATVIFKTRLMRAIKRELRTKNWTSAQAAESLGIDQPRLAEIQALRAERFGADLLVKLLFRLGKEVNLIFNEVRN